MHPVPTLRTPGNPPAAHGVTTALGPTEGPAAPSAADTALSSGRDRAGPSVWPSVWPPAPAPARRLDPGRCREGQDAPLPVAIARGSGTADGHLCGAACVEAGQGPARRRNAGGGAGQGPPSSEEATTGVHRRKQTATVTSAKHLPRTDSLTTRVPRDPCRGRLALDPRAPWRARVMNRPLVSFGVKTEFSFQGR